MASKATGKRKTATADRGPDQGDGSNAGQRTVASNPQATRETVESVVVAVILAFLFRAFIAEAFVIPTGSMAPTLYGRNKDVVCFQCGYHFATGASKEVPRSFSGELGHLREEDGPKVVSAAHCPICRVATLVDPTSNANHQSFSGDRILVSKFSYAFSEPARWDVIVFKYPGNAKQNYIKRLIGLPNEAVLIQYGNIYTANLLFRKVRDIYEQPIQGVGPVRKFFAENGVNLSENVTTRSVRGHTTLSMLIEDGDKTYALTHNYLTDKVSVYGDRFEIQRKPPHKIVAMLQMVDDTNYVGEVLALANWPSRWQDWSGNDSWVAAKNSFRTSGSDSEVAWLRYRHLTPTDEDWNLLVREIVPEGVNRRPGRLIDDYYAYNDGEFRTTNNLVLRDRGPTHWVGDLALECNVTIEGDSGALLLDLVEGGAHYRCRIDVATGAAVLSIIDGEDGFVDEEGNTVAEINGSTAVRTAGSYRLRFANVDDQLTLWVNDRVIKFDGPTTYQTRKSVTPVWNSSNAGDAEPAGVGSEGGLSLEVADLRVLRDIYYVATTDSNDEYNGRHDLGEIQRIMATPSEWQSSQLFGRRNETLFGLEDDDFFPLGDNSPESKDARMWGDEHYVNRELMIGKAVLIYWPHPWQLSLPGTSNSIPLLPNFGRMRLIR